MGYDYQPEWTRGSTPIYRGPVFQQAPSGFNASDAIQGLDFIPTSEIARVLQAGGTFIQEPSPESLAGTPLDEYYDEQSELSLSLSGAPYMASSLVLPVVRKALRDNGIIYYQINILEDRYNFWGLPYWGNYQVKVYMHGSPIQIAWIVLILGGIIALMGGLAFMTWQYRLMKQDDTKRLQIAQDALSAGQSVIKTKQAQADALPPGPAKDAAQAQVDQYTQAWLQANLGLAKQATTPPKESTDMWGSIKTVAIIAGVSLGVIALLNSGILSSAARAIPQRAT